MSAEDFVEHDAIAAPMATTHVGYEFALVLLEWQRLSP